MNSTNDVGNVGSELQLLPRALQLQKRELALTKLLTCYMCSKPLKDTVECDEAHVVCGACFRTLPDKCCQVCKNDIDPSRRCTGIDGVVAALELCKNDDYELEKAIRCIICLEIVVPRFRCQNGHNVCMSCCFDKSVSICPMCQSPTGTIRDVSMERIVEAWTPIVSCCNATNGCPCMLFATKRSPHEEECTFVQVTCPLADCNWKETAHGFLDHLISVHNLKEYIGESKVYVWKLRPPSAPGFGLVSGFIQVAFADKFLVLLRKVKHAATAQRDNVYRQVFVVHLGNRIETPHFKYSVDIYGRGSRRITFKDHVIPVALELGSALASNCCFHMPPNVENGFSYEPDIPSMYFKITITKADSVSGPAQTG